MPELKELIERKKQAEGLSYERMARVVDISRNQFNLVLESGFTDGTNFKTIRGFARLLGMKVWELIKLVEDSETNR